MDAPSSLVHDASTIPAAAGRAELSVRGGPQTLTGKAISRGNALRHGLSAETLLPSLLAPGLIEACLDQLREEWTPETPTQELYLREVARHQAALARAEAIEEAVLREGARTPLALGLDLGNRAIVEDALLAAAGTSEAIERISRYRRQHERALARSLVALRDLKALTAGPAKRPTPRIGRKFTTEHECETYLLARMRATPFRCPRCGHESASWLAARRVWQFDECRRQTGLRAGTILERSRVSLLAWFSTIECVIADPSASLAVIAAAAGLSRMTTLRNMVWRIRNALASSAASQRLAGLDVYFGNRPRAASAIAELSVP